MNPRDALIYLSLKYKGDYTSISSAIRLREEVDSNTVDLVVKNLKCKVTTILDPDYPASLQSAIRPPFVIYYRGNLELIQDLDRTIGFVGSRDASSETLQYCENLSRELAEDGYVIVSGLARGVDTAALKGALKYGKAVAVLGNGINHYYPSENEELQKIIGSNGLLLSEYPPNLTPTTHQFPDRNRLIAAIANAMVIGNADLHSGTMITATFAMSYGRDVGCLPSLPGKNSGCNALIKDGALLVETKEDVLSLLNPYLSKADFK